MLFSRIGLQCPESGQETMKQGCRPEESGPLESGHSDILSGTSRQVNVRAHCKSCCVHRPCLFPPLALELACLLALLVAAACCLADSGRAAKRLNPTATLARNLAEIASCGRECLYSGKAGTASRCLGAYRSDGAKLKFSRRFRMRDRVA